ncbi:hypothetical protein PSU4_21500 [Pseudonocardia sulfidoxydans NBRC 16205]|uniref:Luciferase-like domain-containing protein n=1 Tax=Pseudonocardia sulfidoxydans NBRC 16205 TaxID=1223511 RepID=A0A511DEJ2_9PSEU|nr:LLM class flavin-dependent oxidoreductase [Pseudonocardia sulfidoxydans]GEL23196.1 hypothetical protein PSU4_21500 [Pseudonocardia sulfidoxydans NBRC 16205]
MSAALARVARFGDGLLCAAPQSWAGPLFETVARSWEAAGRSGEPRNVAQVDVALGPPAVVDAARSSMPAQYEFTGDGDRMAAGLPTSPEAVRGAAKAFADLGVDALVRHCWATDPDQVDRLADLGL